MNDWEALQKACEDAAEVFENAIQNFIDEWNNCAQRMIEKYGNRMTLEQAEQQGVIANDSRRNQRERKTEA